MRSVVYRRNGGPDVLELVEEPVPEPGPGEVRVKVAFSGVNPTDWKNRRTAPVGADGQIPNQDGSGTIDAVGPGVDPGRVGERVWLWEAAYQRRGGTAAEHTVLPSRQAVPLTSGSLELGAALAIPFLTAHRCLTAGELLPDRLSAGSLDGRTVLVQGGAGAVGNAAIQLARWAGATVLATVSSAEKAALATAAGASDVINYREADVVAEVKRLAPDGVDVIAEVAAAQNAEVDAQVVGLHGTVAVYAATPDDVVTIPVRAQMTPNVRWQFVLVYTEPAAAKERAIEDVQAALAAGAIRVGEQAGLPLHVFPLAKAADAHRASEEGAVGKVLIDVTS